MTGAIQILGSPATLKEVQMYQRARFFFDSTKLLLPRVAFKVLTVPDVRMPRSMKS